MRISFFLLLAALLSGCTVQRIYVVRHADRAGPADALTPAGYARAQLLADTLAKARIQRIFVTPTARTRLTATPLSQRIGVSITEYQSANSVFFEELKRQKTSLVVGHSNTVLPIVKGLGGNPSIAEIGENQYGFLFIVTRKKSVFGRIQTSLQERSYGIPTP